MKTIPTIDRRKIDKFIEVFRHFIAKTSHEPIEIAIGRIFFNLLSPNIFIEKWAGEIIVIKNAAHFWYQLKETLLFERNTILFIQLRLSHSPFSKPVFYFFSRFKFNFVDIYKKPNTFFLHFRLSKSRSGNRAKVVLKNYLQIEKKTYYWLFAYERPWLQNQQLKLHLNWNIHYFCMITD